MREDGPKRCCPEDDHGKGRPDVMSCKNSEYSHIGDANTRRQVNCQLAPPVHPNYQNVHNPESPDSLGEVV